MKNNGKPTTPIIAANTKKTNGNKPASPNDAKRNGAKRVSRVSSRAMDKLKCDALERISDGIIAFDAEMNHMFVNERAGMILGREPQDLVGKNFLEVYPDLTGTPFVAACQRATETQTVVPFDGYFAPSNTWFEACIYPSDDGISILLHEDQPPQETKRRVTYNIHDVSQFPEQNPNPVMRFTRDGELLYANPASAPLLASWKGQAQYNLPSELHELLSAVSETDTNKEIELKNGGKTYSCIMVPVPEADYVNLYFNDLTERKQAQESINALIHQTITGITRTDMNGELLFVNQSFCEMVGYSESELLGKAVWDLNHPDDIAKNKHMFERMISEGDPYQLEKRIVRRNGSILWVTVGTSPLRDASGQIYAAASVIVDITRRKRAEQSLLDNARRTLYLATLSDAIRSLNSISQIETETVRILALHLKASRVAYATVKPDGSAMIQSSYTDGMADWKGAFNLSRHVPNDLWTKLRAGRTVILSDTANTHRSSDSLEAQEEPGSISTQVVIPLLKEGELVAAVFVQQSQKREWKNEEIHVMEETAERMQTAIERARAEQELRESEKRFRILSNAVPSMVWSTAPDGTVQYLNEYWYRYTGLTTEQSITNWKSAVHPEDHERVFSAWEHSLTTGADYALELRYRRYDGEYRWFQSLAIPARDEKGNITTWYGVSADIHDRVDKEVELQKIINSTPFMLTRCSRDFHYQFVSRAYAEMIGRTPEQVAGKRIVEIMGEKGFKTILPYVEQVLQGKRVEFETEVSFENIGVPVLHIVYMPDYDERGEVIGWIASIRDVTERKQAEEALRASEEKYRQIVETANEGIWEIDKDTRTVFVNRRMAEMLGYAPEEIVGHSAFEFVLPEDYAEGERRLENAKRGTPVQASEFRYRRKDGSLLWTLASRSPKFDEQENFVGAVAMLTDITERKKIEDELKRSNQLRNEILTSIQDDFYVLDRNWNFVYASRSFTSKVGKEPEDFIGKNIWEMFPKHVGTNFEENFRAVMEKREIRRFEVSGKYTNAWYQMAAFPSAEGITVLGTDITERKRMENALRESEARLTLELSDSKQLQHISSQLIQEDNIKVLYEQIIDAAMAIMRSDAGSMQMLHPEKNELELLGWKGFHPDAAAFWDKVGTSSGGSCGEALRIGTRVSVSNVETSDVIGKEDREYFRLSGIKSMQSTPLVSRTGYLVGMISTHWHEVHEPSEHELELLDVLARQAADLIERKQGERALVEYARQQSALYKLVDQLHRADTLNDVFDASLDAIVSALQCDRASILLFDETRVMHFVSWRDLSDEYRKATDGHSPWKYGEENPMPVWYDDISTSDLSDSLKAVVAREGIGSLAFIPLVYQEELIGKFMVYFNTPHVFMESEINLSLTIARQLAASVDRKRAEELLRSSEDRLRLAVAAGKIGIWDIDLVRRDRTWSKVGKAIYGLAEDEYLDFERQLELTHPDDRAYVNEMVSAFRDQGTIKQLNLEHRIIHPDSSVHWVEVQGEAVYEEGLLPVRLIGTIVDITERKRVEEQLRQATEHAEKTAERMIKLQQVTAALSGRLSPKEIAQMVVAQGIAMFNAVTSTVMILSEDGKSLEILYSTAPDEVIRPYKQFSVSAPIPAADAVRLRKTVWIESRQAYLDAYPHLADQINYGDRQAAISVPMEYGGRVLGVLILSFNQPREFNPEDEKYFRTLAQQATQALERTRAERSLRESEERYRAIVNQATAGIVRKDALGNLLVVNDAFCQMLGYSASELQDKTIWQFTAEEDFEQSQKLYNDLMAEGIPFQQEKRLIRKDGSRIWVTVSVSPVLDARGKPESAVSVYVDLTERKQAEGRLALLTQISELTRESEDPVGLMASVAHAVGKYFQAKRCLFNEIDTENDREIVHRDYHDGVESVAGIHQLTDYSSVTTSEMMAGKIIVNFDSKIDPRTAHDYERSYVPTGERAYVAIPLMREDRWVASLWISDDKPRNWSTEEVALLRMIAERTWTATEKLRINAALLENQQRLALTYEHAPIGIIETSADGSYVRVNEEFCKITGYTKEELLELGIQDLTYENDYQADAELYGRLFAGEIPFYRLEKRYARKDGGLLWAELVRSMIYDENGIPLYSTGAVFDITERKRAEEELRKLNLELEDRVRRRTAELQAANEFLRESEATSRLILESMPDAIIITDEQGHIVYGNAQVQTLFGYSAQEVIGQPVEILLPRRFHDKHLTNRSDYSQNSHRRYMGLDRDLFGQRKDQSEFPVDVMLSPISNNTNWDVMVTIRDSTEQKEAQQAIRANEEKLRKLFQVLPIGVSFLDNQGQITEMNSALTQILGLSKHELLEGRFRQRRYVRSDGTPMPPSEFASIRAHTEQKPIYNVETGIVKENGETIWTSVNAAPVDIADVDVVVATIDITERKRAEEALHKHRERLRILSRRLVEVQEEERRAIARELHDRVGQNLAALNLNLNILRSQLTNTALLEVGQRLSDSVNLVNQILTITRNVMGDLRSDVLDDYGLEAAVREYAEQFTGRTGVQVVFDKSAKSVPRMDPSIEMTLLRITQEALTNVAKHAQAKQAMVSVSSDSEAVYMSIQDDGIGILSWQRANQPGSHGLRIIRERAEAFGGSLQVQSTYKKGTRIDVKIPLGNLSQPKVSREKRS